MDFTTKDSGKRVEFVTGSRRDTEDGKLDYTLLPLKSMTRLVGLYMRGAEKYTRFNWQKGQDMGRVERSLMRHLVQYFAGERDEDHLAAVAWNTICLLDHEDRIASGNLPSSIDTRDEWRRTTPPPNLEDKEPQTKVDHGIRDILPGEMAGGMRIDPIKGPIGLTRAPLPNRDPGDETG